MTAEVKNNVKTDKKSYIVPTTDIFENENEFKLFADMPGVTRDGVDIEIANEELEIKGRIGESDDSNNLLIREFRMYDYYRKFTVGNNIDSENVKAKMENGVLELTLPKREELKPRKIEISAE